MFSCYKYHVLIELLITMKWNHSWIVIRIISILSTFFLITVGNFYSIQMLEFFDILLQISIYKFWTQPYICIIPVSLILVIDLIRYFLTRWIVSLSSCHTYFRENWDNHQWSIYKLVSSVSTSFITLLKANMFKGNWKELLILLHLLNPKLLL